MVWSLSQGRGCWEREKKREIRQRILQNEGRETRLNYYNPEFYPCPEILRAASEVKTHLKTFSKIIAGFEHCYWYPYFQIRDADKQ